VRDATEGIRRFGSQERLLLGLGVDLGVAVGGGEVGVGGGEVGVPEPAADHVDLDAGLEQVHGGGVPEDVRADPSPGSGVVETGGGAADDLVDPIAGQRLAARGERGRWRRRRRRLGLQQLVEDSGGLSPERAGPPFVALAVPGGVPTATAKTAPLLPEPREVAVADDPSELLLGLERPGGSPPLAHVAVLPALDVALGVAGRAERVGLTRSASTPYAATGHRLRRRSA
jgi:hypothetical protein